MLEAIRGTIAEGEQRLQAMEAELNQLVAVVSICQWQGCCSLRTTISCRYTRRDALSSLPRMLADMEEQFNAHMERADRRAPGNEIPPMLQLYQDTYCNV